MTDKNFERAFSLVVKFEGDYSNDPQDPGGETRFGISKRAFPDEDIKGMTLERAKELYKKHYWEALHCESLQPQAAFAVFDAGVNCGVSRAAMWLQAAVGAKMDGVIGPRTLEACAERSATLIAVKVNALRLDYYTNLPGWGRFGAGWVHRVTANLRMLGD